MRTFDRAKTVLATLLLVAACASPGKPVNAADPAVQWEVMSDVLIVFVEEPSGLLQSAYSSFLRNDMEDAVSHLRKAATFVFMQAQRSEGEMRTLLEDSVRELNSLIADLEGQPTVRAKNLEEAFARAEYRLAMSHLLLALSFEEQENYGAAGYALDAAAAHLLFTIAWLDENTNPDIVLEARQTRSLAADLRSGAKSANEKLHSALKKIGRGISSVGKAMGTTPAILPEELVK